jgi:hypothetical protein
VSEPRKDIGTVKLLIYLPLEVMSLLMAMSTHGLGSGSPSPYDANFFPSLPYISILTKEAAYYIYQTTLHHILDIFIDAAMKTSNLS